MSKPASTAFSAKPRHGLAWHPSLPNAKRLNLYIKLSEKNCDFANQITKSW